MELQTRSPSQVCKISQEKNKREQNKNQKERTHKDGSSALS